MGSFLSSILPGVGTAVDIAGGIFGNLFNANQARKAEKRQFQMQKDLMSYQNDMNRSNWLEQTEYNSPANQMKRLQEAGLNPNLVYGHGANAMASPMSSVSGGSSRSFVPHYDNLSVSQPIAQYALTQNSLKQNQLLEAQTDYTKNKAAGELIRNIGLGTQNRILGYQSDYLGNTLSGRILGIELDNILKSRENDYKGQLIEESNSRIAVNNANIGLIEQKTGFTSEQSRKINSEIEYLVTKNLLGRAELSRYVQMTPSVVEEIQNRVILLSDEHDIKELYKGNSGLINYKIRSIVSDIDLKQAQKSWYDQRTENDKVIPYLQVGAQGVRSLGSLIMDGVRTFGGKGKFRVGPTLRRPWE